MSYFETLNQINVNDKTEERNGLTYLSWAWAWGELKKRYPLSYYTVHENADGLMYHHDDKTAWVKTGVTVVDGDMSLEHIEYLPVMDFRNKSISVDSITSFDVNKAIQRSLTQAIARHGLGLYIYAGEDLPDGEAEEKPIKESKKPPVKPVGEPAKIAYACLSSEYDRRCAEAVKVVKKAGKTEEQYKAIKATIDTRSLKEMTAPEYDAFLLKLTDALK